MFIRLKTTDGTEVNLNTNQIVSFAPTVGGSVIQTECSVSTVVESTRSIRNAIKKATSAGKPVTGDSEA